MQDWSTEVVVLGGGGAGLCAAIAARASGAEVCLISKSEIGVENCTAYSWGGLAGSFGSVSAQDFLRRIEDKSGGIHHPRLATLLAEHGAPVVEGLSEYGVAVQVSDGHASVEARPFRAGEAITLPLADRASELGCRLIGPCAAVDLEHQADLSLRLSLLDLADGSTASVECRAIVIATGGMAGLFGRSDNPGRTTGDGLALALRAGAHLIDVEFLQIGPLGICEPGLPFDFCNVGPLFQAGRLTTPEGEPAQRGQLDGRWRDMAEAEGGADRYDLALDLSDVSASEWQDNEALRLVRELILGDFPVEERALRCSPLAHYTPGGIQINPSGATWAPGVFAAGEAAGGTFGAARPGGGALTDAIVFGAIAGRAAGSHARGAPAGGDWRPPPRSGAAAAGHTEEHGRCPAELLQDAQDALWSDASVYQTEKGLARCYQRLEALRGQTMKAGETAEERLAAVEAGSALLLGQALVRAARLREETRGEHRRLDFPETDSRWESNIVVRLDDEGELRCCTVPYPAAHNTFDPPWLG